MAIMSTIRLTELRMKSMQKWRLSCDRRSMTWEQRSGLMCISLIIIMHSVLQVMSMIAVNEEVPDIEKLERQDFILDTEEHERLKVKSSWLTMKGSVHSYWYICVVFRQRRASWSVRYMRRQSLPTWLNSTWGMWSSRSAGMPWWSKARWWR